MSSRRCLLMASLFAATLHGIGVFQSILPAQDGLKFIRVARQFQTQPWGDVVRGSDQHPLYPALIALTQPLLAPFLGQTPTSWRVAAQLVSVAAYFALLWPLHALTRRLFNEPVANLCVGLFVLLPIPAGLGRDTLSDVLGLCLFVWSLSLAERALREGSTRIWLATGMTIGLGYLARPEIILLPVSIGLVLVGRWLNTRRLPVESDLRAPASHLVARMMTLGLGTFVLIGAYALTKGEVSEKLALRTGAKLGHSRYVPAGRTDRHPLPNGLDDARWDFSAKEESERSPLRGKLGRVVTKLGQEWFEGIGFLLAPFAVWGLIRSRKGEGAGLFRNLLLVHLALFSAVVARHATVLGYLSGRHALSLVLITLPFAALGLRDWARSFPSRRGLSDGTARRLAICGVAGLMILGVVVQSQTLHPSRWGHWKAGRWLAEHASASEAVLDTRGWATFVRGGPAYDYWHVRQALSDSHLSFLVVGADELSARSGRAETLRAVIAYAATPVATFPEREGGEDAAVLVYAFHPPKSWEGLAK